MRANSQAFQITFVPANVTVSAQRGDTLLDAALDNGIAIGHECGGNCSCTTCHVRIESGREHLSPIEWPEDERLDTAEGRTPQSRLACQALVMTGNIVATILPESLDSE